MGAIPVSVLVSINHKEKWKKPVENTDIVNKSEPGSWVRSWAVTDTHKTSVLFFSSSTVERPPYKWNMSVQLTPEGPK